MATLGKLRERSGLVIVVIGLAMLGFIATDLLSSRSVFMGNSGPSGIGKIYGEEIDPQAFQVRFEKALNNQRSQMGADASITPTLEGQINDQIWEQMISERLMEKEALEMGLSVTGTEIMDLSIGQNPHPIAMQFLVNQQSGQIDRQEIYKFITTLQDNPNQDAKIFWSEFEKYLSDERIKEKYFSMVSNAMFVTDIEAKEDFESRNKMATIQFVPLFLNAIADSTVEISDDDIKEMYNKRKEDYKREAGRTFEYVMFDVNATKDDTVAAEKWINQQIEAFRKTKNDSNFVARIGRSSFSNQFLPHGSYPVQMEDQIFTADSGTIIGPVYEDGKYKIAKVLGSKSDSMYYFKASHILFRPGGSTEEDSVEAYNKAKELLAKIRGGEDFAKMAQENSQDPSNASKGGDLGWFKEGAMVKRFNDAVKKANKGDLLLVRTEFGTHIIKVTENKSNKLVKAAIIERAVTTGSTTEETAYNIAAKFRSTAINGDAFNEAVTKMKLTKRLAENIRPNQKDIANLENPRELIRWAYDEETRVGDVSDPKRLGNRYVVAHLVKTYDEGYTPWEEVKDELKALVLKEKKRELLAERFNKAMEGNASLESIAQKLQSNVNTADNVSFQNTFIPNLSNEPKIAGATFGLKKNQVSKPIKGENGVYVIKVTNVNDIKAPEKLDNDRKTMMGMLQNTAQNLAMEALRKGADVKDLRYIYY